MKIAFVCPKCGRPYEVDASHSGRKARCKDCGGIIQVPAASTETATAQPEPAAASYALADLPPSAVPIGPPAFVPSRPDSDAVPPRSTKKAVAKSIKKAKKEAAGLAARVVPLWPWLLGVPAGIAVALGLVAAILPGGAMIVASILAIAGIVLVLGGWGLGIYVAFTEDGMYGWLCLLFPPYTAYYMVTNWEEMWLGFAIMTGGAALVTIASAIMGAGMEM
jgi:DNA-directed RNA polymerase subunit RPC12/RpoP